MGRRLNWLKYTARRLLFWGGLLLVIWVGKSYYLTRYDAEVVARGQTQIRPLIQEIPWSTVDAYFRTTGTNTLIFVYSSESLLSRWYFDDMNQLAAEFARYGVVPLFISVDGDVGNLANYLASKGDLYFTPLHMPLDNLPAVSDVVARAGGDFNADLLPYMGVMDHVLYLDSFTPGIVRTNGIRSALMKSVGARKF